MGVGQRVYGGFVPVLGSPLLPRADCNSFPPSCGSWVWCVTPSFAPLPEAQWHKSGLRVSAHTRGLAGAQGTPSLGAPACPQCSACLDLFGLSALPPCILSFVKAASLTRSSQLCQLGGTSPAPGEVGRSGGYHGYLMSHPPMGSWGAGKVTPTVASDPQGVAWCPVS